MTGSGTGRNSQWKDRLARAQLDRFDERMAELTVG